MSKTYPQHWGWEQANYLRCRILDRIFRFLRPSLRRPLPDFLTPTLSLLIHKIFTKIDSKYSKAEGTGVEPATPVKGHLISSEAASHSPTLLMSAQQRRSKTRILREKPILAMVPGHNYKQKINLIFAAVFSGRPAFPAQWPFDNSGCQLGQ